MTDEQRGLVEGSYKLVGYTLKGMRHILRAAGMPYADARQEGYLALCKAAVAYDAKRGYTFATLAKSAIWRQVLKACYKHRCVHKSCNGYKDKNTPLPIVVSLIECFHEAPDEYGACELRAIIDSLPRREQTVVILTIAGYTQDEIAKALGFTQPTAGRSLAKARKIIGGN
jgi:RNA polymerase sigma factor (sigma-70 family)